MYTKLIIYLFSCLFCYCSFSQSRNSREKSILIYSDDNGYMQPFIEKTIKNLRNTETDKLYFTAVNSFNRFISDNKYQAELNDLVLSQKPSNLKLNTYYSDAEKQIRERIFNILKGYNYFLTVKTNTLGELIEFQFQLFETVNSDNSTYNISDKVLSVENFFINPKEKEYTKEITNALQRLFRKSNKIPDAELRIYDKIFTADTPNNKIKLPIKSKIIFDGSNSGDNDTETISYHWRNIIRKDEKYQTTKKIIFIENSAVQEITIKEPGIYQIGFKVFDGIEYSKEIILTIEVYSFYPVLRLIDSISYSKNQKTFFSRKSKKNLLAKLYVFDLSNDSLKKSIILSKEPISQKTRKDINGSLLVSPVKLKKENFFYYPYLEFDPGHSDLEISEKKTFYLYQVDNDGNLHNEKRITNLYLARGAFNFRAKFNSGSISFKKEGEKEKDVEGNSYSNVTLAIGMLLTNNLELELSFPLNSSKDITYNGYIFSYPNVLGASLNYLFFKPKYKAVGDAIPYLGCNLKTFNLRTIIDKKFERTFSLGPEAGFEYVFKSWRGLDLDLRLNFNYDFFTDRTFKDVTNISAGLGVVLKI